jgi:hypothetical protein
MLLSPVVPGLSEPMRCGVGFAERVDITQPIEVFGGIGTGEIGAVEDFGNSEGFSCPQKVKMSNPHPITCTCGSRRVYRETR